MLTGISPLNSKWLPSLNVAHEYTSRKDFRCNFCHADIIQFDFHPIVSAIHQPRASRGIFSSREQRSPWLSYCSLYAEADWLIPPVLQFTPYPSPSFNLKCILFVFSFAATHSCHCVLIYRPLTFNALFRHEVSALSSDPGSPPVLIPRETDFHMDATYDSKQRIQCITWIPSAELALLFQRAVKVTDRFYFALWNSH